MHCRSFLTGLASGAGGLAAAGALACPSSGDLGKGIRVDYGDESYSIITRDAAGTLREVEYSGDEVYVYVTENGLLETGYEEPGADTADRFEYTFDTSAIVPPEPWSGQRGEQITRDKDGAEVERLGFSYYTRGRTDFSIGECRYAAMGVQTYYDNPDERSLVEFVCLLDLGVPLVLGYGGPGYFEPHTPTAISAVD